MPNNELETLSTKKITNTKQQFVFFKVTHSRPPLLPPSNNSHKTLSLATEDVLWQQKKLCAFIEHETLIIDLSLILSMLKNPIQCTSQHVKRISPEFTSY